jgi:hypothetical protein
MTKLVTFGTWAKENWLLDKIIWQDRGRQSCSRTINFSLPLDRWEQSIAKIACHVPGGHVKDRVVVLGPFDNCGLLSGPDSGVRDKVSV